MALVLPIGGAYLRTARVVSSTINAESFKITLFFTIAARAGAYGYPIFLMLFHIRDGVFLSSMADKAFFVASAFFAREDMDGVGDLAAGMPYVRIASCRKALIRVARTPPYSRNVMCH
jgi:hypothetical protein